MVSKQKFGRIPVWFVMAALISVVLVVAGYKLVYLGYTLGDVLPETHYHVTYHFAFDGHDRSVKLRTFLPATDQRQTISEERNTSPGLHFDSSLEGQNLRGIWTASGVADGANVEYTFDAVGRPQRFELGHHISVPDSYTGQVAQFLKPEPNIQVDDAEIVQTLVHIRADRGDARSRLRKIFELTSGLTSKAFKGTTDALTALRLGEASCNGKSRLFVALSRAGGMPARLVGGLILQPGSKRTSHQWVEVYVGGRWVPFCPTNQHFAELPANYLVLYRGDESLVTHTADINFDYEFETKLRQVPAQKARQSLESVNAWALFDRLNLPFSLLRTLLMLPIGALVVVLCRNIVGIPTFGTFLPALLAAASLETGALWGGVGVLIIVTLVALVRLGLQRFSLLHSPTLAILLAAVTIVMLATSLVAEHLGIRALTRISLFPIAVLAITAERFYVALADHGAMDAARELSGTLFVMLACYALMNSLALQALVVGFPEVLLVVVAFNVYLGTWTGIRLSEYLRFRQLMRRKVA